MNLILSGKPQKQIIVYSVKPRNLGEEVRVYDNGQLIQTGKIIQDMSEDPKYQAKKRIGSKDVSFNAGKGYYRVKF
jgi:hypothetical protein